MINAESPKMKAVFLPDTSITSSPLQPGAMYKFHALDKTVVVHIVMEPNATIDIEMPNDNVIMCCTLGGL